MNDVGALRKKMSHEEEEKHDFLLAKEATDWSNPII